MKHILFGLFAAVLCASCSNSENASEKSEIDSLEINNLLSEMISHSSYSQYDSVIIVSDKILSIDPNNYSARIFRAYGYRAIGKLDQSKTEFRNILNFDPYNKYALLNIGIIQSEQKEYEQSIHSFTRLIMAKNIFPDSMFLEEAYYQRAYVYEAIHQWRNAIDDYKKTLELFFEIDSNDILMDIGDCYEALSEYDSAIFYYSIAIDRKPNQNLYNRRGIVYAHNKQYELALIDYTTAIDLGGNWHSNRALVYRELGELDKALKDANTAIELWPKNDWAYGNRALILFDMKRYKDAIPDFKEMMNYDTTQINAYSLGKCYLEIDSLTQAIMYLEIAKEMGSEDAEVELKKIQR